MNKCICGGTVWQDSQVREGCKVDEKGHEQSSTVHIAKCEKCGIIRQINLPFSSKQEFIDYYKEQYPPVKQEYSIKNYEHDRKIAKLRCNAYKIHSIARILDVGSGSGAFVDECRDRGAEAYGCEIGKYHYCEDDNYIYSKEFEDIHFPTDYFDLVTCHDVLEHSLNPLGMIEEMFRIVKQLGNCIIDFPRFYHESGEHHWKDSEHIWYFNQDQLEKLVKDVGFKIEHREHPIESKIVLFLSKPVQKRTRIIVPPGIGDAYWSLVKLESFLKKKQLKIPVDVLIGSLREKVYNTHKRAFPYLQMIPFLNSTGEVVDGTSYSTTGMKQIWKEAYFQQGRTAFEIARGYFISYNGYLRAGKELEEVDELKCNWNLPRFISLNEEKFRGDCISKYGNYMIVYFVFQGSNSHFFKWFKIDEIAFMINSIADRTELTPVFAGAVWDLEDKKLNELKSQVLNHVDLVGKTNTEQLFGLMRGSKAVVGTPSGLTIMSAVEGMKTVLLWHDYFTTGGVNRKFAWNVFPPQTRKKNYFAEYAENITTEGFVERVVSVVTDKTYIEKSEHIRNKPPLEVEEGKEQMVSVRSIKRALKRAKRTAEKGRITITCVMKSGGDYGIKDVYRLKNMINRNTTLPYDFLCITDDEAVSGICDIEKLQKEYSGWWSKVELFKKELISTKKVVYFDLDTVILGNIDALLDLDIDFAALKPWNSKNRLTGMFASGMMAWNNNGGGRYSFVYDEFDYNNIETYPRGDQEYMYRKLVEHGYDFQPLQELIPGIYSYKRDCRHKLPRDAKIVCFHGKPRPKELLHINWIEANWR